MLVPIEENLNHLTTKSAYRNRTYLVDDWNNTYIE